MAFFFKHLGLCFNNNLISYPEDQCAGASVTISLFSSLHFLRMSFYPCGHLMLNY